MAQIASADPLDKKVTLLCQLLRSENQKAFEGVDVRDETQFQYVTYGTHRKGYLPILEHQVRRQGVKFSVVGMGTPWRNFFYRHFEVLGYIREMPRDKVILVSDAYDVLVLGDIQTAVDHFLRCGKDIVFGKENHNFWTMSLYRLFFTGPVRGDILNGGFVMARCGSLCLFYEALIAEYEIHGSTVDDQIIINRFLKQNPQFYDRYVGVDREERIIYNMCPMPGVDKDLFRGYTYEGFRPVLARSPIVHGMGNTDLDFLLTDEERQMLTEVMVPVGHCEYLWRLFLHHKWRLLRVTLLGLLVLFLLVFLALQLL